MISKIPMSKKRKVRKSLPLRKGRMLFVLFGLVILFTGLTGRLYYVMLVKGQEYKDKAVSQWVNTIPIEPKRGRILDRNGQVLAMSSDVFRIDADLEVIHRNFSIVKKDSDKSKPTEEEKQLALKTRLDKLAADLAKILSMDVNEVLKILKSTDKEGKPLRFVNLKRKAEKIDADAVVALKIHGLMTSHDTKRYYPDGAFLSHVIGHINMQGDGITGVELAYNSVLTGVGGYKVVEKDLRKNELPYSDEHYVEPIHGKDVVLTIDERIQAIAEKTADEALKLNKAKSVSITVMNPKNGEILAMVNKPDYNPNSPLKEGLTDKQNQELWKNRAISDVFEPGSIFKVITAAAGLNAARIDPKAVTNYYKCEGSIKVANRVLSCDQGRAHGVQTLSDIIKNSCNVGFIQLAKDISKERFLDFGQLMGFGKSTGLDLPGESSGLFREFKNTSDVDLAAMSYGHGLATTQIQYLAALNIVANGGTWHKPHVMKEISHMEGDKKIIDKVFSDNESRTVMIKEDTQKLRPFLERVVKEGTAMAAYIEELHLAGKTGTAVKVNTVTGGYDQKYVSSFAAMAPADDPVVTAIITVDEPDPQKYYAGETAAPAAKELFMGMFNYLPLK